MVEQWLPKAPCPPPPSARARGPSCSWPNCPMVIQSPLGLLFPVESISDSQRVGGAISLPPRLIDGTNITMEDEHMWLIPFSPGEDHIVTIHFTKVESLAGLRIWNYNKSPEDTYRGVSWQLAKAFCLAGEMAGLALWPGVEPSGGGWVVVRTAPHSSAKQSLPLCSSLLGERVWLAGRPRGGETGRGVCGQCQEEGFNSRCLES